MKHSRRTFFKQGLAGAPFFGTSNKARAALSAPVKPKTPTAGNPLHLGEEGENFCLIFFYMTLQTLGE